MTRICYTPKKFGASAVAMIDTADTIMREYAAQGFSLTLRQLYYQFVARGLIPNAMNEYKRLGTVVNDGRMAGMLDWDNIEDRTRGIERLSTWSSPRGVLASAAAGYRKDLWVGQEVRPEVWIEKEALAGVIEPTCNENRVDYLACRGYLSQSEAWRAGMRIVKRWQNYGQKTLILHLGDHDPSGIDMTRDNRDRLDLFCSHHVGEHDFEYRIFDLKRIALNMDQVESYSPPPNPAKLTDSRASDYVMKFGDESWELDALDPSQIAGLIQNEIDDVKESEEWGAREEQENLDTLTLEKVRDNWEDVAAWVNGKED